MDSEIAALWAEYGKSRSERVRNQLMEHYLPLVKRLAQRVHANLPREVELDDLISAGTFGLMYAVEAFDPGREVKFETYCASRVRGAILDHLRSCDWVPRLPRMRSQRLEEARRQLQAELGRNPSREELATRLNVSLGEFQKICRDAALTRIVPMGAQRAGNHDDAPDGDQLEDCRQSERARMLEREDLRALVTRGLSRAEQLILVLYYFEQMTMKEIGLTLDLSESRVSQMHSAILERLKQQLDGRQRELASMAA
jgi:RNA polymerase sigma factor for flagellar operon FliA